MPGTVGMTRDAYEKFRLDNPELKILKGHIDDETKVLLCQRSSREIWDNIATPVSDEDRVQEEDSARDS